MNLYRPATFSGSEFSLPYLFETFISMAQPPYFMDDHGDHRLDLIPPSTLDVNNPSGGDPSSMSYIPRATRSAPRAHIVHTIHVKKITYPLSTRPDELWILEINQDGLETWRSIESFLQNLNLTQDHRILHAVANQWRIHYDIQPSSTTSTSDSNHPVLPHPEHSNVRFGQPVSAIPDHTYILQACWGRSANHHSQGPPTSLYWPPTRTTPPTSPTRPALGHPATTSSRPTTSHHPDLAPDGSGLSSNADMSDSSV